MYKCIKAVGLEQADYLVGDQASDSVGVKFPKFFTKIVEVKEVKEVKEKKTKKVKEIKEELLVETPTEVETYTEEVIQED